MSRVKQLSRNAVFAWSPKRVQPLWMVAGTSAQQFDASFNSSATLDLCQLDLGDSITEMQSKISIPVDHRFHCLEWTDFTGNDNSSSQGIIAGGSDAGLITFFDADRLITGAGAAAKISQSSAHSGQVLSLSSNPYQPKLLASGAGNSEVFIWDLNQSSSPMAPGPKQQPFEHVVDVEWSPKVEHILGSLSPSKAFVWDLRKGDGPILTLGDLGARAQWRKMAWNPDAATSVYLASEEDNFPVVQSWDVRFASAPLLQLEGHTKGILSMDWCAADSDLMVTCAKDLKMYLWNPNTATFLGEVPMTLRNWPNLVSWCPRNPNLIGCASTDSKVTIYSLTGGPGSSDSSSSGPMPSPKLAESFPGADFSASGQSAMALMQQKMQQQTQTKKEPAFKLPQVPKWLRPGSCGATFTFGNRLITFEKPTADQVDPQQQTNPQQPQHNPVVSISQVITDEKLHAKSADLGNALSNRGVAEFCERQRAEATSDLDRSVWQFLQAHSEGAGRREYAAALGIDAEQIAVTLEKSLGPREGWKLPSQANGVFEEEEDSRVSSSEEASQATSSHNSSGNDPNTTSEGVKSWESVKQANADAAPLSLSSDPNSQEGMIVQSLMSGQVEMAAEICVRNGNWPDAFQLAMAGGTELFERLQRRYALEMSEQNRSLSRMVAMVTGQQWSSLVECTDLAHWREVFGMMLSFAPSEKFSKLAVRLGERLQKEGTNQSKSYAALSCVAAGAVDSLLECLTEVAEEKTGKPILQSDPQTIMDIFAKVTALRWSVGGGSARVAGGGSKFLTVARRCVELLVAQGDLQLALTFLLTLPLDSQAASDDMELQLLKDRLLEVCGVQEEGSRGKAPQRPYPVQTIALTQPQTRTYGQYQQGDYAQFQSQRSRQASLSSNYGAPPPPAPGAYGQRPVPSSNTYGAPPGGPGNPFGRPPMPGSSPYNQPSAAYAQSSPYNQASSQPPPPSHYGAPPAPASLPPPPSGPAPPSGASHIDGGLKSGGRGRYPSQDLGQGYGSGAYGAPNPYAGQAPATQSYGGTPMGTDVAYGFNPGMNQQSAGLPPPPSGGDPNSGRRPPVAAVPPRPAAQVPRGWNDPPSLNPRKKETTPTPQAAPPPMTQPVLGMMTPASMNNQHGAPPMGSNYGGPSPGQMSVNSNGFQSGLAPINTGYSAQPSAASSAQHSPVAKEIPVAPIPPEHVPIQQVLDKLADICLSYQITSLVKKRVTEAKHKFEMDLYPKLRTRQLSETTLQNLLNIVQCVQTGNYQTALQIHTQMAQGLDFAQISTFMPPLKALLQTSAQMRIQFS